MNFISCSLPFFYWSTLPITIVLKLVTFFQYLNVSPLSLATDYDDWSRSRRKTDNYKNQVRYKSAHFQILSIKTWNDLDLVVIYSKQGVCDSAYDLICYYFLNEYKTSCSAALFVWSSLIFTPYCRAILLLLLVCTLLLLELLSIICTFLYVCRIDIRDDTTILNCQCMHVHASIPCWLRRTVYYCSTLASLILYLHSYKLNKYTKINYNYTCNWMIQCIIDTCIATGIRNPYFRLAVYQALALTAR
jgi:hypothetical protein